MSDKEFFELYNCTENMEYEMNKLSCLANTLCCQFIVMPVDSSDELIVYSHQRLSIVWDVMMDQIIRLEDWVHKSFKLFAEADEKREKETTEKAEKS